MAGTDFACWVVMMRPILLLGLLGSFLAPGVRAEHLLAPRQVTLGEEVRYLVRSPWTESLDATAQTTVHAPVGDGLVLDSSWVEVRSEGGKYLREDGFRFRPVTVGTLQVKPALVEGPGVDPAPGETLELVVLPPSQGVGRELWLVGGVTLLALSLVFLWRRRDSRPSGGEGGRAGGGVDLEELLAPCRQARLRGDVQDFHVRLYAVLRERLWELSGRRPRDPKGFAEVARQLGLPEDQVELLRSVATRCERVVFGGEEVSPTSLQGTYEGAAQVLTNLQTASKETAT